MKRVLVYGISFSVILGLAPQPAFAQSSTYHDHPRQIQRSSAFGGVTFRVPLGGSENKKATLRLQATRKSSILDTQQGGSLHTEWPAGLEIGLDETIKPSLFINGQNAAEVERKLAVQGETKTVLVIAGTAALIALILVAMKGRAGTAGLG